MPRVKRQNAASMLAYRAPVPNDKNKRDLYRAAAYMRLSVEDSGKTDGDSLENQEKLLRDFITRNEGLVLQNVYVDNGFTGTQFSRPAFDQMMDDVRAGKINCVVVKDLSRLGRNYLEAGQYIENIFPALRVRFIAVNDHYDSLNHLSASEELAVPFKNLINEAYVKDISVKVSTALEIRKKQGLFLGKYPPYGYLKDPNNKGYLAPDPETCGCVRQIFQWYAEGNSLCAIAKRLNEAEIASPARYLVEKGLSKEANHEKSCWTRTTVRRMLGNRIYIGELVYGKEYRSYAKGIKRRRCAPEEWKTVPGAQHALIDQPLFDVVQERLQAGRETYYQQTGVNAEYAPENLFRGLIHCGDCGSAMKMSKFVHRLPSGIQRYALYECCRHKLVGDLSCPARSIRKSALDQAVLESIRLHVRLFLDAEAVVHRLNRSGKAGTERKYIQAGLMEKQKRLRKLEELRNHLYEDLREGLLERGEYRKLCGRYAEDHERLCAEIETLEQQLETFSAAYGKGSEWSELVRRYLRCERLDREMLESFLADVQVFADGKLRIVFRFQDEWERMIRLAAQRKEEVV